MSERRSILQESLAAIERLQARLEASEHALRQPIAIVGAGCRYPGGIESPEALWRVVRDGIDAVSEIPADRWDADAYYDPDPQAAGKMVTRRGGFLSQVDRFDPQCFGISPREATTLDPQQRLLLETASEALESAGLASDRLAGSLTGVFVGITTSDYGQLLRSGGTENSDVYSATGSALNAAAGRLSFTYGFQGPCVAVDTACSSSLVAVHLACQSLRTGESNLALAGGVNVVLSPDAMVLFSRWGMMAPDGACKTFDAAADGFVRAEGCAVIALKRLSDAVAAGDPILAVIRGSAVNSDGRSSGLTVPNGPAQQAVLRSALANAGIEPADIDYVEAHGTGTSLGDPIEVEALGEVMRVGRAAGRPLAIGSIKTNLGHTEAASGLAGLLKVVMALRHEAIPPHLHFSTPNPGIPWADLPITVPTKLTPWPRAAAKRRAGVSSFGFSGTNAHVILEEAPPVAARNEAAAGPYIVPVTARDEAALRAVAGNIAEILGNVGAPPAPAVTLGRPAVSPAPAAVLDRVVSPPVPATMLDHAAPPLSPVPSASLADVAFTLATGRTHHSRRLALVTDSPEDLRRDLLAIAAGQSNVATAEGNIRAGQQPKIAFLFTGQGAQYPGMGRVLYDTEPVFRAQIDRAVAVLAPVLPRPLLEVLFPADVTDNELAQTVYTQPALFALEYALAELWRSWGITPSVVMGHSVGEYAAACVAGVFNFEEGLALIAERARLMQALPAGGGMAAVFADEKWVLGRLDGLSHLSIAAVNGPEQTVVAGDAQALARLLENCTAAAVKSKTLDVSHAFHSHLLDPMLDALERRAATIRHAPPRIPLVSNLTGTVFAPGTGPDARYWRTHAREPVRFAASLEALQKAGVTALLEIGPHPTLLAFAARALPSASWLTALSMRRGRDDRREMLTSLASLYAKGAPVKWDAVVAGRGGRRIALPTYPFQRERYWVETPGVAALGHTGNLQAAPGQGGNRQTARAEAARSPTAARASTDSGHPLLGKPHALASAPGTHVWQRDISLDSHPWLGDHRVQGAAIVPATAYIEMALAAGGEVLGGGSLAVREIENLKPIILHDGVVHRVQVTLVVETDGSARFSVHGHRIFAAAPAGTNTRWIEHMTARLARIEPPAEVDNAFGILETLKSDPEAVLSGDQFYALLANKGNQWGAAFQGMRQVWRTPGEALGRIDVPPTLVGEVSRYRFHPAVSDACGHALVATVPLEVAAGPRGGAFVGGGVGEIRFHRSAVGNTLWSRAVLRERAQGDGNVVIGDVWVYDETGALVSETLEARLWYLDDGAQTELLGAPPDWFYEVRWQQQALTGESSRSPKTGPWIVFADRNGLGEKIASIRDAAGLKTVVVTPGDAWHADGNRFSLRAAEAADYARLLAAVDKPAAVLHLWSLDSANTTADTLESALNTGVESVLNLLHGIRSAGTSVRPRLWLLTSGAQAVIPGDRTQAPWAAALWGVGKSLSVEHAEIWGGLIDTPAEPASDELAQRVIHEVDTATAEDQIAFRGRDRWVARLERRTPGMTRQDFKPSNSGTYLVTGGLGGVGLAMARWLVEQGARHLLLLGRTALPPREKWNQLDPQSAMARRVAAISAIEALGARVDAIALDVADGEALRRCLEVRRDAGQPPIRGVIHAAGVLKFEALETQTVQSLREVLAAKVRGAWELHRLLADEPLDCFVMCSSTSALLRSPLLGGYAAGNAFLDALAHERRAAGLPALSVNWGTWGEVGMAVEAGRSASGAMLTGVATISTARGLAALRELLETQATQVAVMPIDWAAFAGAYPAFAADIFLESQVAGVRTRGAATREGRLTPESLDGLDPDARARTVQTYLHAEAARVLGFVPARLDPTAPLSSFGFDSLMAVQLKNRIEADLGLVVPMIQFLQGPSVEQLVPVLLDAAQSPTEGVAPRAAAAAEELWEVGSL
jgi:acyl transferase domain-containing protein